MDMSCLFQYSSFYVNHLQLWKVSWQLLPWCPVQSIPSLFSHLAFCFKPTNTWQIIATIKADSWKWMVISPVGTSSSMPFLWVWHVTVPATNCARCSFSVSADPVQLNLLWQILTASPTPSNQPMLWEVAADWRRLPTLGPSLSLMRMCVCVSVFGSADPVWLSDKEHAWWVRQWSIACLLFQKHSRWCCFIR